MSTTITRAAIERMCTVIAPYIWTPIVAGGATVFFFQLPHAFRFIERNW
jgi:hypothetical protein